MKFLRTCWTCLFAASFLLPIVAQDRWKTDKATGCRIETPQAWEKFTVQWTGTCVAGVADGTGVLKALCKGKVQKLYYGRAKQGILEIGVIEADNGYVAGRFADGKPVQDGDRQTYIQAFRAAVAAANQASEYYRKRGNETSARYYAAKAKSLDQQMD
jgi:hypothetical protein